MENRLLVPEFCLEKITDTTNTSVDNLLCEDMSFRRIKDVCRDYMDRNQEIGEYIETHTQIEPIYNEYLELFEFYRLCKEWITKIEPALLGKSSGLWIILNEIDLVMKGAFSEFDKFENEIADFITYKESLQASIGKMLKAVDKLILYMNLYISNYGQAAECENKGMLIEWRDRVTKVDKSVKDKCNIQIALPPMPKLVPGRMVIDSSGYPKIDFKPENQQAYDAYYAAVRAAENANRLKIILQYHINTDAVDILLRILLELTTWLMTFKRILDNLDKYIKKIVDEQSLFCMEIDLKTSKGNWNSVLRFVSTLYNE